MSRIDDRLTERFRATTSPALEDEVLDAVERRVRRGTARRRVGAVALSVVVLTGSVGGFLALRNAFEGDGATRPAAAMTNGGIAFVRRYGEMDQLFVAGNAGSAGSFQDPVQVTAVEGDVRDPAWSPDGHEIAFVVVRADGSGRIAIYELATGSVRTISPWWGEVATPRWSPDGQRIVFVVPDGDEAGLWLVDPQGVTQTWIAGEGMQRVAAPVWSPDGGSIAFSARLHDSDTWDVYVTPADPDGTPTFFQGAPTPNTREVPIAWLRNGNVLAASTFEPLGQPYDAPKVSESTWVELAPDGAVTPSPFDALREDLPGSGRLEAARLRLSPDGDALLLSATASDLASPPWIVAQSSVIELSTGAAHSADWQPVDPSDPPPPALAPEIPPPGVDVGLGLRLCQAERLGGLDLLPGSGPDVAWTGFEVNDAGICPRDPERQRWAVAIDVTGDGVADASTDMDHIINCPNVWCFPLDATDLDADGDGELVVSTGFSIRDHGYFSISGSGSTGFSIEPILVADPGHPAAYIEPGEPLITSSDGDAGYAAWIRCENYPEAPILVYAYVDSVVESEEPAEWHEVKLRLERDGMFHVVDFTDLELPPGDDPGFIRSDEPACGIAFSLMAGV